MLSLNPFSILAETVSPVFMQSFVILMGVMVVAGTLLEIIHKKNFLAEPRYDIKVANLNIAEIKPLNNKINFKFLGSGGPSYNTFSWYIN